MLEGCYKEGVLALNNNIKWVVKLHNIEFFTA